MMSKRFFLLLVLIAFIPVFAVTPHKWAVLAAGSANAEGMYKHMSIALIFPDSASRAVTYAKDYNSKMGADVMDVNALFADLSAAFERSFKSVVRASNMEEARAKNVDLVAVLDLQYTLPVTVESDVAYEVSATIMTPAQVKVDIVRGSSAKSPTSFPGNNGAKRIGDAIRVAEIEAEYRLEDALHSSAKMAAFIGSNQLSGKETSATPPPQMAAGKSELIARSSSEKKITAPSSAQTATVEAEIVASPFSKKTHRDRSSKRTAKVKSSPSSTQVTTAPPAIQKAKAAPKATAGASSQKEIAAPSPSPEYKRTIKSDVRKIPSTPVTPDRNAYAIVIGVEQYRQKLPKADFASHDAQAVAESLTKAMSYPPENVITLINDQATHADLAKYIEKWLPKNVKTGSTVFIYFSGLGTSNPETGEVFLVPFDGDPSFIDQTGYSLKRMDEALRKLPAKEIIVVLDSCFSGAGGKSILVEGARPLTVNLQKSLVLSRNMTVLTAASGDQMCSSYQAKGHSLFTYYLLNGIRYEDVVLPDGSLDIGDLFSFVQPQVERIALKRNNSMQSPQLIEPKMQ